MFALSKEEISITISMSDLYCFYSTHFQCNTGQNTKQTKSMKMFPLTWMEFWSSLQDIVSTDRKLLQEWLASLFPLGNCGGPALSVWHLSKLNKHDMRNFRKPLWNLGFVLCKLRYRSFDSLHSSFSQNKQCFLFSTTAWKIVRQEINLHHRSRSVPRLIKEDITRLRVFWDVRCQPVEFFNSLCIYFL